MTPTPNVVFMDEDQCWIVSHEDDLIVLLVIMMERNVHCVLIDQGSSTNVMWLGYICGPSNPKRSATTF